MSSPRSATSSSGGDSDVEELATGIHRAVRVTVPPPRRTSVTELVRQCSVPVNATSIPFDNTAVHEDHWRAMGILTEVYELARPNAASPMHDIYLRLPTLLTGWQMTIEAVERDITPLEYVATDGARVTLSGRMDLLAEREGRAVVVEVKTTSQTTARQAWRDLLRRTYIQQLQLYALAVHRATGIEPWGVVILGLPSSQAVDKAAVGYMAAISYTPRLWLSDAVNKHPERWCRFSGDPAPPCAAAELTEVFNRTPSS